MGQAGSGFGVPLTQPYGLRPKFYRAQPSPGTRRVGSGSARGLSLARIASVCYGYYHNLPLNQPFRPLNSLFGGEIRCLGGSCEPDGLLGGLGCTACTTQDRRAGPEHEAQPAQVAQPARPQSVSTRPISKPINYRSNLSKWSLYSTTSNF